MKDRKEDKIEVEIREHSDADFFPEKCPDCKLSNLKRLTYKVRELQDLGSPLICRRVHYERVYFECKECGKVFTIEHPLIPINARYMPGVVQYAVERVLKKGDSIRRVAQDLNELHLVKVSETSGLPESLAEGLKAFNARLEEYKKTGVKIGDNVYELEPPHGNFRLLYQPIDSSQFLLRIQIKEGNNQPPSLFNTLYQEFSLPEEARGIIWARKLKPS